MITLPNAKINLGLHVVSKRPDGFHNIETVFYPVNLCDALEIIPSEKEGVEFSASGLPIPGDPADNLVLKAVNIVGSGQLAIGNRQPAFAKASAGKRATSYEIHLYKAIPSGSGLGGGSSDAAYTIKMLNELMKMGLSVEQMQDLARQLGSDCAFFIENRPVLATGRGDRFQPVELDLSHYRIEISIPEVHVSTAEAYALVTPRKPEKELREIIQLPVEEWKDRLVNDFEKPVMRKYPVIRETKEEIYNRGALYAAMSGSGAAVYGIFSKQ